MGGQAHGWVWRLGLQHPCDHEACRHHVDMMALYIDGIAYCASGEIQSRVLLVTELRHVARGSIANGIEPTQHFPARAASGLSRHLPLLVKALGTGDCEPANQRAREGGLSQRAVHGDSSRAFSIHNQSPPMFVFGFLCAFSGRACNVCPLTVTKMCHVNQKCVLGVFFYVYLLKLSLPARFFCFLISCYY